MKNEIVKDKIWEQEIQDITDRYKMVKNIDIVVTGSSSARMWETVEEAFYPYSTINTGFGGSKLEDNIAYMEELVTQYCPKIVVFWSGSNNIHGDDESSFTGQQTFELFADYYEEFQKNNPHTILLFLPVNPTRLREHVWDEAKKYNTLVQEYALKFDDLYYIDVTEQLLIDGKYNEENLLEDGLHLSKKGYNIISAKTMEVLLEVINSRQKKQ